MKQIITEQFIQASPEKVWSILIQSKEYGKWNPFIIKMEGAPVLGQRITNTMKTGKKEMVFKPIITKLEEGKELEWLGSMPLGMFNGRHFFRLKAHQGGTLLEHGEYFTGWLHGLILSKIGEETRQNFIALNNALRDQAEKG